MTKQTFLRKFLIFSTFRELFSKILENLEFFRKMRSSSMYILTFHMKINSVHENRNYFANMNFGVSQCVLQTSTGSLAVEHSVWDIPGSFSGCVKTTILKLVVEVLLSNSRHINSNSPYHIILNIQVYIQCICCVRYHLAVYTYANVTAIHFILMLPSFNQMIITTFQHTFQLKRL